MGKVSRVAPHLSLVEIQRRIRQTTGFWKVKKWLVIWHATVDPSSARQIALHTGLAEQTVHNLIALYNRCGPDVMEGKGKGGRRRAYLTEREEIRFLEKYWKRAAKGELVTVREIKRGFEKVVGRMVHKSTISRLLKRHGWRNVVPRPRHVEADPLEQETFKKTFAEKVTEILAARDPNDRRPVLILAEDEGRFGRISGVRRAWAPRGCRPVAPRQVVRKYLYGYVAVCPALGKLSALVLPWANTAMMRLFLDQVSRDFTEYFLIILMDQAGWHVSQHLMVPENVRIIRQPARSPELNPVEHIWDDLREKYFVNRAFPNLDTVEETLCKGINYLAHHPNYLKSLTNFPFLNVTA